jgi:tRNA nucleotidyltransferase (CCA-adding enzyme)
LADTITSVFDPTQIPDDVLGVCRHLGQAGHQAHLVGGGIRDLLLGREPADFDVATNALPDTVLKLFGSRYAIPTGLQHGTITVLAGTPVRHVEVTTFRGEGEYLDGRRPSSVSFSATLQEDLARRDFTMNAIAFDPLTNTLTDPFDGQAALSAKIVKAVGDPVKRFTEDGLRPMRAVRQATQLGFSIDPQTLAAISVTLDSFRMVSAERIRDEIFKMFKATTPSFGIRLMQQTKLLDEVFPELLACVGHVADGPENVDVFEHSLAVLDALPPVPTLRLAGLWHDVAKPGGQVDHAARGAEMGARMADRLRLSVAERRLLCDLVSTHEFEYSSTDSDASLRRLLRVFFGTSAGIEDILALHTANRGAQSHSIARVLAAEVCSRIRTILASHPPLRAGDLAIDGKRLMSATGMPPGRQVGVLLSMMLDYVVDEPEANTEEGLLVFAKAALQKLSSNSSR